MYDFDEPLYQALDNFADYWQVERRESYAPPESAEEAELEKRIEHFAHHALKLIYNPDDIGTILDRDLIAEPWEEVEQQVAEFVGYKYVSDELEADAAREVIRRLRGLRDRVKLALLSFLLLKRTSPSDTAKKYLQQVIRLYLAGFEGEVSIMAGAVLEAAIRDRISDEEMDQRGFRPIKRTGDYPLRDRMKVERELGILDDESLEKFWEIMNWRNDAVHVQYDAAPPPAQVVWSTAGLLTKIQPG